MTMVALLYPFATSLARGEKQIKQCLNGIIYIGIINLILNNENYMAIFYMLIQL
jgi:hypothetical protein